MDFDNRKVYGDTSITDGLVFSGCLIDCLRHMVADEGKAVVIPTEAVVSILLMIE